MINELRYIPIIHFLDILRKEGLDIGVNTHLQFFQILNHLLPNIEPEQVKSLLSPLAARNEAEQILFYELFDQHAIVFFKIYFDQEYAPKAKVEELVETIKKEAKNIENKNPKIADYQDIKEEKSNWMKSQNWALVATISVLLFLIGTPIYQKYSTEIFEQEPLAQSANDIREEAESIEFEEPDLGEKISIDEQISKSVKRPAETQFTPDTTRKLTFSPLKINDLENLPNRLDNHFGYQIYQNQAYLKYALILAILIVFLLFQLKNFLTKKDLRKRNLNPNAPDTIELNIPKTQEIDFSNEFYNVVKKLNIRQETARQKLDIQKTVAATVESGGQWNFQFAQDNQLVEYLFLIEQQNTQNHSAKLFDKVYQTLKENDLFVERFFFNKNLENCWNEKYAEGISLIDLQQRFKHHFLLIFSSGENLLKANFEEVQSVIKGWEHRAILTPKHLSDWGAQEAILSEMFHLFPASLDGFTNLINSFEDSQNTKYADWKFNKNDRQPPIKIDADNVLLSLNEHFSKEMQGWIAACAVYPELHWDLTLRLGHLLSEGGKNTLVTHGNLFQLSQLEWFQEGKIPDEIRAILLNHRHFTIEMEKKVRREICRILENSPAEENSIAEEKRTLLLAINQLHLNKTNLDALEIYREQTQKDFPKDAVSIAHLNRKASVLSDWMPSKIKNLIFLDENPMLGTRMWVRFVGVLLLCLVVQGFSLKLAEFENKIEANGSTYSVNGEENQQIFYSNFSNYHFNKGLDFYQQNLFFKAGSEFERAVSYQDFSRQFAQKNGNDSKLAEMREALAATYLYRNQIEKANEIHQKIQRENLGYFQQKDRNIKLFLIFDFVDYEIENRIRIQQNGNYGFLNDGWIKISTKYDFATNFNNGKALVNSYGERSIIDLDGKKLEDVESISIFENTETSLKGFLVNEKFEIIPAQYSEISELKNGFYKVEENGKFGFYNENLKLVIPTDLKSAKDFNENGIVQVSKNGKTYFVNNDNKCVAECPTNSDTELAKANYQTFHENGKYGFKDKDDNIKIPAQYLEAWYFGNAKSARVRTSEGWGLIDKNAKPLTDFKYDQIDAFQNGAFMAQRNGKKGFLNEDGEEISAFIYDFAMPFMSNDLAVVRIGTKYGVIDKSGIPVIKVVFDNINLLMDQVEVKLGKDVRIIELN